LFENAPPRRFETTVRIRPLGNITEDLEADLNEDNSFVIPNVFPIQYELLHMTMPGFYVKSIQYGERDCSDGRIHITSAGAPLTLVLASDSAKLTVTVKAADGSPVAGAQVILAPSGNYASRRDLFRGLNTGPTGAATFIWVAPGDYKIFAFAGLDYDLAQVEEFRNFLESRAVSVSLQTDGTQSVQVQLIPAELIDEARKKLQ